MKKIILLITALIVGYGIYNFLQPLKVLEKAQKSLLILKNFSLNMEDHTKKTD